MTVTESLVVALAIAVAVAAVLTLGVRRLFSGRNRLLSNDGGSPALRALTATYGLLLAFVLASALGVFNSAQQQTTAEADTVSALGNFASVAPAPVGVHLRQNLICYATTVINQEFPAMQSRQTLPLDDDTALLHMYRTLALLDGPHSSAATTASYQVMAQQLANLTTQREARIRAARNLLPTLVWILIVGGGVIVLLAVAAVTFVDRPWPQFFVLAAIAAVIATASLLILSLNQPFVTQGLSVTDAAMKAALVSLHPGPVLPVC